MRLPGLYAGGPVVVIRAGREEWWRGKVRGAMYGGLARWDSVEYTIPAPAGTVYTVCYR